MGHKYFISARMSGICGVIQEGKTCKTFLGLIINLIIFRFKYPIVDVAVLNGYGNCDKCKYVDEDGNKPLCCKRFDV